MYDGRVIASAELIPYRWEGDAEMANTKADWTNFDFMVLVS